MQKIVKVPGPADRDCDTGDAVFQNKIPAGEPGKHLPERRIGKRVGAAGNRYHRGHFRITERGERTSEAGQDKGQDDAGAGSGPMGITDNGCADQDENAGSDDCPDPQAGEIPGRQGLFESMRRMVGVREELIDGFRAKQLRDHRASARSRSCQ